jgi:hypothetical protein
MGDNVIRDMFLLFALLIIVVYYIGAATDTNSLANGLVKLSYAFTGRDAQGKFAAYPTGATQPAA